MTARPLERPINDRREIRGWAMYDWANSAFSTTVAVVFLGLHLLALVAAAAGPAGDRGGAGAVRPPDDGGRQAMPCRAGRM